MEPRLGVGFGAAKLIRVVFASGWEGEQAAEFGLVEIEEELAGNGVHFAVAGGLHVDALALDKDAQFGERIADVGELGFNAVEDVAEFAGAQAQLLKPDEDT